MSNHHDDLDWFFSGSTPPRPAPVVTPIPVAASRPAVDPPPPPPFPAHWSVVMEGEDIPPIPERRPNEVGREVSVSVDELVAALQRSSELRLPTYISERRVQPPYATSGSAGFAEFLARGFSQQPRPSQPTTASPSEDDMRRLQECCASLRQQAPVGRRIKVRIVEEPQIRMVASVTGGTKWYHAFDTHNTTSYGPMYRNLVAQLDGDGDAIVSKGLIVGCFVIPGFEPPSPHEQADGSNPQIAFSRELSSLQPAFGKVTVWIPREEMSTAYPPSVLVLDPILRPMMKMRPQRCKHCRAIVCGEESELHLRRVHPTLRPNRPPPELGNISSPAGAGLSPLSAVASPPTNNIYSAVVVPSCTSLDNLQIPAAALVTPGATPMAGGLVTVTVLESSPLARSHPHVKGIPKDGDALLPEHVLGVVKSMQFNNRIGEGGQGVVWAAKRGDVTYAAKVTLHEAGDTEVFSMCTMHQRRLHHEHLIPYICVCRMRWTAPSATGPVQQFGTMVTMPYYSNGDLARRVRNNTVNSLTSVLQWGLQLARVLRYLHGQKIQFGAGANANYRTSVNSHPVAHGDIKLENVLLCDDDSQCVLMDLDNCQLLDPATLSQSASTRMQTRSSRIVAPSTTFRSMGSGTGDTTTSSDVVGTYEWMAPELVAEASPALGDAPAYAKTLTPASDVWALGQLLYVILSKGDIITKHPVTGEFMSLNASEWGRFPRDFHHGVYGQIVRRLDPRWQEAFIPPRSLASPLSQTLIETLSKPPSVLAPQGIAPGLFRAFTNQPPTPLSFTQSRLVTLVARMMCHVAAERPTVSVVEEELSAAAEEILLSGVV